MPPTQAASQPSFAPERRQFLVALPNTNQLRQGIDIDGIVFGVGNSKATHGHGGYEDFFITDPGFKMEKLESNDCNEVQMTLPKSKIGRFDGHQHESIACYKTPDRDAHRII